MILLPKPLGYDERSAINDRSRTGRGDRRNMARAAADAGETSVHQRERRQFFARTVSRGGTFVPRMNCAKMIDIGEAEIVRDVLRVCRHLANGRDVLRAQVGWSRPFRFK